MGIYRLKGYKLKKIQIVRLISQYMFYFFTSFFIITIFSAVWYFHSHYPYPIFCNTCFGCRGCSHLLSIEYEQNKLLFFRTRFPWIVTLNIIVIILTIIFDKLFKNSLIRRLQKPSEFNKYRNLTEKIYKLKYKEDIKSQLIGNIGNLHSLTWEINGKIYKRITNKK